MIQNIKNKVGEFLLKIKKKSSITNNGNSKPNKDLLLLHKISYNQIVYATVNSKEDKNIVTFICENSETMFHYGYSLQKVLQSTEDFIRVAGNMIINVTKIVAVNTNFSEVYLTKDKLKVTVSETYKKDLKNILSTKYNY